MRVTLIGAGPGDAGLLTQKAAERLQQAEVVLYDRLVGADILKLIPATAEKIDVGKNTNQHPVPQPEINQLLLDKALQGLEVVRLKGGDPFVFGRGGEELELLAANHIPFEVIPGISSAIASAAYAGIPVTHRDYTSSVHLITGHAKNNGELSIDFASLVKLNGTLVFMMSIATIEQICTGCIAAGMDPAMPAAIVENGTTTKQRSFSGTVATLPQLAAQNQVVSPALVIIGKVCQLAQDFAWFKPNPKSVIVTRTRANQSQLAAGLKALGLRVVEMPCIEITPITENNPALEHALANLGSYSWLVFTSGAGVESFFNHLQKIGQDIRSLGSVKIAAVGTETAKSLTQRGLNVDFVPKEFHSTALAAGLIELCGPKDRLLLLRAQAGTPELPDALAQAGLSFDAVHLYQTQPCIDHAATIRQDLAAGQVDLVTFTSSSTVEGFVASLPGLDFSKIKAVCIGDKTAATARANQMQVVVSDKATIISLVAKVKELVNDDY